MTDSVSGSVDVGRRGGAAPDDPPATDGLLKPSETVGRYVVLYRLGIGGMGVVYAAYDPELDRKVALKLLRRLSHDPKRRDRAQARLIKEARAMARLSHPNAITVHDVAVVEGRVVVAMEYVEGRTLSAALAERALTWREALDLMVRAGRGLEAAHEVGIVHRDFKPDNVMLANDGRVLVMDFGLAQAVDPTAFPGGAVQMSTPVAGAAAMLATRSAPIVLRPELRHSRMAGTPAYMAPEQHAGGETDGRSDQFSFCVTLYEALFGHRPFRGGSPAEIAEQIGRGRIPEAPAHVRVPGWLRAALVRGLAVDPIRRYASMRALLAALSADPARRRRKWLGWAAVPVAVVGAGAGVYWGGFASGRACDDGSDRMVDVWDAARRQQVEVAFTTSGKPFALASWHAVDAAIGEYVAAWKAMHLETCEATRVRGEQSDGLLDVRMECLSRRLTELQALSRLLRDADSDVIEEGVAATGKLVPLSTCADTGALTAPVPVPDDPSVRAQVEDVRERLAHAKAQEDAGRYARGLAIATEVVDRARAIGHAPLLAEALHRLGRLQYASGDMGAAEESLREAIDAAAVGHHDEFAARGWIALVLNLGHGQGRFERAEEAAEIAAAAVTRAGGALELRADLAGARGTLEFHRRQFADAKRSFAVALELQRELVGEDHPSLARFLTNLAVACEALGEHEEAERYLRTAVTLQERHWGADHPQTAVSLANLAASELVDGDFERAQEFSERAIGIWERSGAYAHPDLGRTLFNLGEIALLRDDGPAAEENYRRAVEVEERSLGEHPDLALALGRLASVLRRRGDIVGASEALDRALSIVSASLGETHPQYGALLGERGRIQLDEGRHRDAVATLERAFALVEHDPQTLGESAQIQFALARALIGDDRARALELARASIASYERLPVRDPQRRQAAAVERFIANEG